MAAHSPGSWLPARLLQAGSFMSKAAVQAAGEQSHSGGEGWFHMAFGRLPTVQRPDTCGGGGKVPCAGSMPGLGIGGCAPSTAHAAISTHQASQGLRLCPVQQPAGQRVEGRGKRAAAPLTLSSFQGSWGPGLGCSCLSSWPGSSELRVQSPPVTPPVSLRLLGPPDPDVQCQ